VTYKLEPGLNRISSPVVLILPDGKHMKFENGKMVSQALFDRKYQAVEFKANSNDIEIVLKEPLNKSHMLSKALSPGIF